MKSKAMAYLRTVVFISLCLLGCTFSLVKEEPNANNNKRYETGGLIQKNTQQDKLHGNPSNYAGKTLNELIYLLKSTPGYFRDSYIFGFTGDDLLFDSLAKFGHAAVECLVDCMDNMDPAVATASEGGQPVSFGTMCYVALRSIVYYEPEIGEEWDGTITDFPPSEEQLRKAKEAWKKVVKEKLYEFL